MMSARPVQQGRTVLTLRTLRAPLLTLTLAGSSLVSKAMAMAPTGRSCLRRAASATTGRRSLTSMAASERTFLGGPGEVPKLGLGLAALGRPGYINLGRDQDIASADQRRGAAGKELMRKTAFDCLDAAWDAGIKYYDCARSYGASEEFLSEWLASRDIAPDEVVVGSKW